jgi:nitrous oxidase accessory protein NosD
MAAAIAGSGVAHADDTAGTSSSASSASAKNESATKGQAKNESPTSASDDSKTDGDDRTTNDDNDSGGKSAGGDDEHDPSEQISDEDSSDIGSGDTDSEELDESTDLDAEVEDTDEPAPVTGEHSGDSDPRKTQPDAPGDDDPVRDSSSETDGETTTSVPARPKPAEDVDQSASDSPSAATPSTDPPATRSAVASRSAEVDAGGSQAAQALVSVSITDTEALPPAAPNIFADLVRALLIGLQSTFFPSPAPTFRSTAPAAPSAVAATDSPPSKEDAGLSDPFQMPDPITGTAHNVLNYGATSNNSSDNDAAVIQMVINGAQAGDVVYIPDGIYHIKSTINLKPGISLVGQSREGTVLAGLYGETPLHAMIYAPPGVNNLTVSSFTITLASGSKSTYKAGVRLGLEGAGATVSRIAVKDLFIEKFERFGVQLQNANHVLVDNNTIKNATALDGGGQGYGIIIDQSLSSNNWIRNNTIGPVIRHAILIQKAHNNLIENNRITGAVSGAIDLHGEDEYANEIRYNTISDCVRNGTTVSPNGAGIEIGEYSGVIGTILMHDNSGPLNWIHHNTVYNCSCGLRIMNNSNYTYIEDNIFRNNLGSGIQADLAPLNNLYISRNQIYNNGNGIILYDVTQAVVKDNIVRNNANYGIATNPGVTGYIITGNTVTNNKVNVYLGSTNGIYIPNV